MTSIPFRIISTEHLVILTTMLCFLLSMQYSKGKMLSSECYWSIIQYDSPFGPLSDELFCLACIVVGLISVDTHDSFYFALQNPSSTQGISDFHFGKMVIAFSVFVYHSIGVRVRVEGGNGRDCNKNVGTDLQKIPGPEYQVFSTYTEAKFGKKSWHLICIQNAKWLDPHFGAQVKAEFWLQNWGLSSLENVAFGVLQTTF